MTKSRPLKLCLIALDGGLTKSAIVATSKKRMVEILYEARGGRNTLYWLNGYGNFHEHGLWFDRFAPLGEGMWVNQGHEYGEFNMSNWERVT